MKAQRYLGNGSVSIFSSVKRDLDKRKVYLPSSKIVSFLGWPGCQVSMVSLLPIWDSFYHPNSVFFFYTYCQVSNQGKYLRTPVTLHLFCLGLLPQKCRFFHDKQNFTKLKVVEDDDYLLNYIYYTLISACHLVQYICLSKSAYVEVCKRTDQTKKEEMYACYESCLYSVT